MRRYLSMVCSGVVLLHAASAQIFPLAVPDGQDLSLGDVLYPAVYVDAAWAEGQGLILQGMEPSLSLRLDQLSAFASWHIAYDGEDWEEENEEAYFRFSGLSGGSSFRAGQFLNRFGVHNSRHLHTWDWRDAPLPNARFLGEEGSMTTGGEVTLPLPLRQGMSAALSLSLGEARMHAHGEEDDGDHDEDEEEHNESAAQRFGMNVHAGYALNESYVVRGGLSWLRDDAEEITDLFGFDLSYVWRENGFMPGGQQVTLQHEFLLREDTLGVYTQALWRWHPALEAGLRADWAEADDESAEAWRVSPLVAFYPACASHLALRLQVNHLDADDDSDSQRVMLGLSYGFGGAVAP